MSKLKSRNSLLSSNSRTSYSNSTKDELISMKYSMNKPNIPLYPLNDHEMAHEDSKNNQLEEGAIYPDYEPWRDHTHLPSDKSAAETDKLSNPMYLNKGYFEAPQVSNEYYSSRNLIQATIFSSTANCTNILKEMSQHLTNAYKTRDDVINRITHDSNTFKIPARVTLTSSKKEAWLRDLANLDVPLSKISSKLPHGIKNKILVDTLCSKNVPTTRAVWFTKCTLYSELSVLRKKILSKHQPYNNGSNSTARTLNLLETIEAQWLQEWTQQVVDYVYKFSREMSFITSPEKKQQFSSKLNYLLTYLQTLYIECLLDKDYFLTSVLKFLREGLPLEPEKISQLLTLYNSETDENQSDSLPFEIGTDYGRTLIALTLVKIFWKDILKLDYLYKDLSESLLLNYFFISKIPTAHSKHATQKENVKSILPVHLKQKLLLLISDSVEYLFKHNTNVFIIPNYWMLVKEVLYSILLGEASSHANNKEREEIRKQLQLINYRNESLMLNMRHQYHSNNPNDHASAGPGHASLLRRRVSSSGAGPIHFTSSTSIPHTINSFQEPLETSDHTFINRRDQDTLRIIDRLDRIQLNDEFATYLKPKANTTGNIDPWRSILKLVIFWCITKTRNAQQSSEGILIVCNFLKRKVLQNLGGRNASNLKAEFENEIMEIIYNVVELYEEDISKYNLYVLINELYQLKVITISSYLRKLIASGIFYVTPGSDNNVQEGYQHNQQVNTHISILQNLPVLNNKQCNSILQRWTPQGFNFNEKFEKGKLVLQRDIINNLLNNSFDENFEENLSYIKDLNVGLKFLLVNWLTTNLKNSISNSPKLIHMTPSIIAHIYNFYSLCDNLTVFFKVFVKFILKNEDKVIIYYLDSLHLISKLTIRHFKLIKFIAGNYYEAATTAYELFKLIVSNYKDLSSRDTDSYDFPSVWRFIDRVIERSDKNTFNDSQSGTKFNSIFSKATADSPMRINAHDTTKTNDKYTFEELKTDLETLLETPTNIMNDEEIKEAISCIKDIGFDSNTFKDFTATKNSVNTMLAFLLNNTSLHEDQEISVIRLLKNTCILLGTEDQTLFYGMLQNHAVTAVQTTQEIQSLITHFKKLLVYEVLQIHDLIPMLLKHCNPKDTGYSKKCNIIIYDILYETDSGLEKSYLKNDQLLLLNGLRHFHNKRHASTAFTIALNGLKEDMPKNIFQSYIFENYKDGLSSVFKDTFFLHTKLAVDLLSRELSPDSVIELCNELLGSREHPIISKEDTVRLMAVVNEFNLPIIQCLLKSIITKDLKGFTGENLHTELVALVSVMLDNLSFQFVSHNSYFGELFNYLDWKYKAEIFSILENLFLGESIFNFFTGELSDAVNSNTDEVISLKRPGSEINLLPIFKDFFTKFSVSSVDDIPSSYKFLQSLSKFLLKLVHAVNMDITLEGGNGNNLRDCISIFLRFLIIHKMSLTPVIIRHDSEQFSFIKNLILLLNSKFLAKNNEKLKILLYDLLLLMKGSLTAALTASTEAGLGDETSPAMNLSMSMSPVHAPGDTFKMHTDGSGGSIAENLHQHDYPKAPASGLTQLSSVFNLPESNSSNPFKDYIDDSKVECAIMLDEKELTQDGDIHNVNDASLLLVPAKKDAVSFSNAFGLLGGNTAQQPRLTRNFSLKSYQLLEDTGTAINDGCINLSLFDSFATKENPP